MSTPKYYLVNWNSWFFRVCILKGHIVFVAELEHLSCCSVHSGKVKFAGWRVLPEYLVFWAIVSNSVKL